MAEAAFVDASPGMPRAVTGDELGRACRPGADDLANRDTGADDRYQDRVRPVAMGVIVEAVVAGVLGLVALLFSLFLSVRIGRSLIRDLRRTAPGGP